MVQILLGSQVRQKIDFMIVDNIDRGEWIGQMNIDFYFHRSLIWLVIIVNGFLFWLNRKYHFGMTTFKYVLVLIGMEFLTGLLFSYAGMPAVLQPVHLVVASAMFAVQLYGLKYLTYKSESLIR